MTGDRVQGRAIGWWFRGATGGEAVRGAAAVFSVRQRLLLLAAFAGLLVGRLPGAWRHGRFVAEEASVFLAYAWHRPGWEPLWRPFGGYLNLFANASTLLVARGVRGGWLALEAAPYCTMAMAFAAQLLPAVLILWGRGRWLAARPAVIVALLAIATMPATEEVCYNVLHVQYHLALAAVLILALDVPRGWPGRAGCAALLLVAPLCGPGAILVLPFFAARALFDRDAGRWAQAAVLAAGSAVQLFGFYAANPARGHLIDPATLLAVLLTRLVVLPLGGTGNAFALAVALNRSQATGGFGWWLGAAAGGMVLATLIVLAARRRDAAIWLVLAALGVAAASFGVGMIVSDRFDLFSWGAGERYNFLPLTLLALALVVLAGDARGRTRAVYGAMLAAVLIQGALRYGRPVREFARGPSWPIQVAAWRLDHAQSLMVWPRSWLADLSDRPNDCHMPPAGAAALPLYCEAGWVARNLAPPRRQGRGPAPNPL